MKSLFVSIDIKFIEMMTTWHSPMPAGTKCSPVFMLFGAHQNHALAQSIKSNPVQSELLLSKLKGCLIQGLIFSSDHIKHLMLIKKIKYELTVKLIA
jgi:hypothetical protein